MKLPWSEYYKNSPLKSTPVLVMAWCSQVTSHYLNQCWPSPMTPYDVFMSQWFKCEMYGFVQWYGNVVTLTAWYSQKPFEAVTKDSFRRLHWTTRNRTTFSSVYSWVKTRWLKSLYFYSNFTDACSKVSAKLNNASGDGLSPNRWQVMTLTHWPLGNFNEILDM